MDMHGDLMIRILPTSYTPAACQHDSWSVFCGCIRRNNVAPRRLRGIGHRSSGASLIVTDADGRPLYFQPHDLRRIFATEAILNGMPPHIAMACPR